MSKILLITFVFILIANPALAVNINGASQVGVRVNNNTQNETVSKAPYPAPAMISKQWLCGRVSGLGLQNSYGGANVGVATDSSTCILFLLVDMTHDEDLKEAYLCQLKFHRKARKATGKPCYKAPWITHNPRGK